MSRPGIQCKPDHPAIKPLVETFAKALGLKQDTVLRLFAMNLIVMRNENGAIWVELDSNMEGVSPEEILKAMEVLKRAGCADAVLPEGVKIPEPDRSAQQTTHMPHRDLRRNRMGF